MHERWFYPVFVLLAIACCGVQAAGISLNPTRAYADQNGVVTIEVVADFSDDPTIGGGFDIRYDAGALEFVSFTFSDRGTFPRDVDLDHAPTVDGGVIAGIGFGNMSGISGPYTVGTLTFKAIRSGARRVVSPTATGDVVVGAFLSDANFPAEVELDYGQTLVTIMPTRRVNRRIVTRELKLDLQQRFARR